MKLYRFHPSQNSAGEHAWGLETSLAVWHIVKQADSHNSPWLLAVTGHVEAQVCLDLHPVRPCHFRLGRVPFAEPPLGGIW